jgi:hypothetical protein
MTNSLTRADHEAKIRAALESTLEIHEDLAHEREANRDLRLDRDTQKNRADLQTHYADHYAQRCAMLEQKCDHLTSQNAALIAEIDSLAVTLEGSAAKMRRRLTAAQVQAYEPKGTAIVPADRGDDIPTFLKEGPLRPN